MRINKYLSKTEMGSTNASEQQSKWAYRFDIKIKTEYKNTADYIRVKCGYSAAVFYTIASLLINMHYL